MKLTSGKLICSDIKWLDTVNYDETVPVPAELPTRVAGGDFYKLPMERVQLFG